MQAIFIAPYRVNKTVVTLTCPLICFYVTWQLCLKLLSCDARDVSKVFNYSLTVKFGSMEL